MHSSYIMTMSEYSPVLPSPPARSTPIIQVISRNENGQTAAMISKNVLAYTAEDAKRDLEGMQTMRTLAQNMSYLLKAQTAVNDAGIGKPEYEKTVYTNFMD